ncbi:MAG TPA: hypothetical protein VLA21_05385 [Candidatus Limnocylindria bacterium]|nr:hypothetical protein [Candidatus Limnocylindria bacterium]
MKKATAFLLALALAGTCAAGASALGKTFTHPEIGEPLTVAFTDHMPLFKIYGFTYYEIPSPKAPVRGLLANLPETVHGAMPTLDEALEKILGDAQEGQVLLYSGVMAEHQEALDALGLPEKVRAVRMLGGFDGAAGMDALHSVPGFEEADLAFLRDGFTEFTVRVGDARYPYRVLQMYVEEPEDHEYFFERYGFLYLDGEWRLARTAREYADASEERGVYVHGVTGFGLEPLDDIHYEIMRDLAWGDAAGDVARAAGAQEEQGRLLLADAGIFRIPAQAEFLFTEGRLSGIAYRFANELSYYSAFISLFMRYADPVTVDEYGTMTWSLNDAVITLTYDKQAPEMRVALDAAP